MLKFGKGKIEAYIGSDGRYLKFWVTTIVEGLKETHWFYVDPARGVCGQTALFYSPKCDMDCFLDISDMDCALNSIDGTLYFTEFQPNYYL